MFQIQRVQNKTLYQQYSAKKKLMEQQNPPGTQNERILWHGTAPAAVKSINALGFNRSYCGKNGKANLKIFRIFGSICRYEWCFFLSRNQSF